MNFDPVHDAQSVFRSLLAAHAFPGTLRDISVEASRVDPGLGLDQGLAALALALVDGEVGFAWIGEDRDSETVAKLCSARARPVPEADFVFAAAGPDSLLRALEQARAGDLVDPQRGATVIALADGLAEGGDCEASGPGIAEKARFTARFGLVKDDAWIDKRAERNAEFPLGLDLVLVDRAGGLMAFPRAVEVRRR